MTRWSRLVRIFTLSLLAGAIALGFAACGARTGDYRQSDSDCTELGGRCDGDECCEELSCRDDVCKPDQLCQPDGRACETTVDCCNLNCENGFCGGVECTPDGLACADGSDSCCTRSARL